MKRDPLLWNKIGAAVLVSLLVWFVSSELIKMVIPSHPDTSQQRAFALVEGANGSAGASVTASDQQPDVDFGLLLASADVAGGQKSFKICATCHSTKAGVKMVGPSLWGVVGRNVAAEDFAYSKAMKGMGGNWDAERISEFIRSPRKFLKGTSMSYAGMKSDKRRADVVAYLSTLK